VLNHICISDGKVLHLIELFLNQEILEDLKLWNPTSGTPQGAVLSPLLANVYLHQLDLALHQNSFKMVRYADDWLVLCQNMDEAETALSLIQAWIDDNGLELSPEKTHIGSSLQPGHGFEFLGYRFEDGRRYVRAKSLKRFKDKIRLKTRRTRGDSIEHIISDLNPTIIGWFGYFKHAHHYTFSSLDGFIRRRLRAVLRNIKSGQVLAELVKITGCGQMPFSLSVGFSPCVKPTYWRANPDEETTDWRAVCGRTACTVRRAGRGNPSRPLSAINLNI
jgi:hypothetical protein